MWSEDYTNNTMEFYTFLYTKRQVKSLSGIKIIKMNKYMFEITTISSQIICHYCVYNIYSHISIY